MSERDQWIKHYKKMEQERADARRMKDLISWADATSRKLYLERVRERKNALSPVRLHNSNELQAVPSPHEGISCGDAQCEAEVQAQG